ncbi:uncharacterized protein LOC131688668 [Topomyia yanbarensis]|uniref:uncharacterized protein LOC131688668 n=1 Tax=Topomyia yanbarensis TaxID=2498891 RepID=UPI00273A75B6|nr:uncharacterized protein LOC131688668 [Topomyia yanbarensis]
MGSSIALFLAVLLHAGLKILVFMDPPAKEESCCTVGPNLRSVLFLSSVVMYLSKTKIFPVRYRRVPLSAQAVAEFFIFLLVIEIAMVIVWCRIEALLFRLFQCLASRKYPVLYADMGGDSLVEFLITLCSMVTFVFTAIGTGYVSWGAQVYDKALGKLSEVITRARPQQAAVCPAHLCSTMELETDDSQRIPRRSTRRMQHREFYDSSYERRPRRRRSSSRAR